MKKRLFLFGLILMLFSFLAVSAALADPLVMPASLRIIEAESFYGDTSISSVVLGDHVQEIRSKAFADSSLKSINLPSSLTFIADDALPGPIQLRVTAAAGTYAYAWADARGYFIPAPTQNTSQGLIKEVKVSWEAVTDASSYNIYYGTSDDISNATEITGVTGTNYTITGLSYGTTYYTWVRAVNSKGAGNPSNRKSVITYPAVPALKEPVVSANSITLNWNKARGASIYRLHYNTENNFDTSTKIDNITETTYTITGLEYDTTYYIWLAAANTSGGLRSANPKEVMTGSVPAAPVQNALTVNLWNVTVSWNAVPTAESYTVYYGTSDSSTAATEITGITETSLVIPDLLPGTTYYTWVKAIGAEGESELSNMEQVITYPSAPTLTTTQVSGNTIRLGWDAIPSATSYRIRYSTTNNYNTSAMISGITATSHTVIGLEFNTKYYVWMVAFNESGGTKNTVPVEITTGDDAGTPKQNASTGGLRKVTVNWDAVSGAQTYNVYYGTSAGFSAATKISGVTAAGSYTIPDLQPGTTYYTWVTAVKNGTESVPSNRKGVITLPPAAPMHTPTVSGNSITCSWTAVTSATSYRLQYGTSDNPAQAIGTVSSIGGTSYTLTDLDYSTTYYIWVLSVNASGSVRNSTPVTATTEAQGN